MQRCFFKYDSVSHHVTISQYVLDGDELNVCFLKGLLLLILEFSFKFIFQ